MTHDPDQMELTVRCENFIESVSEAEVQLIESCLGNLIQAVLVTQDEGEVTL